MTLNLVVVSRAAVYLSGDFRLTYSFGPARDDLGAQKILPVVRRDWMGLVAFCGFAKVSGGLDTSLWFAHQVAALSHRAPLSELYARLAVAHQGIPSHVRDTRLAFSIVGFEGRRPFVAVVSNFVSLRGRHLPTIAPEMRLEEMRPRATESFAVGDPAAVLPGELSTLCRLVDANLPPRTVVAEIARVNERAAGRSSTISRACVAGSILASGALEVGPHGLAEDQEYLPEFVKLQLLSEGVLRLAGKFDANGVALPMKWVGMTAKISDTGRGPGMGVVLHALRNITCVEGPGPPPGRAVFTKIVGPDDPTRYSFSYHPKAAT